jgi:hypothetical protein
MAKLKLQKTTAAPLFLLLVLLHSPDARSDGGQGPETCSNFPDGECPPEQGDDVRHVILPANPRAALLPLSSFASVTESFLFPILLLLLHLLQHHHHHHNEYHWRCSSHPAITAARNHPVITLPQGPSSDVRHRAEAALGAYAKLHPRLLDKHDTASPPKRFLLLQPLLGMGNRCFPGPSTCILSGIVSWPSRPPHCALLSCVAARVWAAWGVILAFMHSFALVTNRMRRYLIMTGESIDPPLACHSMIEEATALLIALETGRALTFDLFDRSMGQGKAWYAPSSVYARPINTVMIIPCHSIDPKSLECIRVLLAGFRVFPSSFLLPPTPSHL